MRFKVVVTRVEQAARWVTAADEEAAVAKMQEELTRPYMFAGQWQTIDTRVEIIEAQQTPDARIRGDVPNGPMLLNLREAAAELGVSYSAMYQLAAHGRIECTQVGSRRFIAREALGAYVRAHSSGGPRSPTPS